MSVVACKVTDDVITIASDSIAYNGGTIRDDGYKLIRHHDVVIGHAGKAADCYLMSHYLTTCRPIKIHDPSDAYSFIQRFRKWKAKEGHGDECNNQIIIVSTSGAYLYEPGFVKEIQYYDAIGAGRDYALAALYLGHSVDDAIDAACQLSAYCAAPTLTEVVQRQPKTTRKWKLI